MLSFFVCKKRHKKRGDGCLFNLEDMCKYLHIGDVFSPYKMGGIKLSYENYYKMTLTLCQ